MRIKSVVWVVAGWWGLLAPTGTAQTAPPLYLPGHAIVRLAPAYASYTDLRTVPNAQLQQALVAFRITSAPAFPHRSGQPFAPENEGNWVDLTPIHALTFDTAFSVNRVLDALKATGVFQYVEPRVGYQSFGGGQVPLLLPNDPLVIDQYHLTLMRLDEAWDLTTGDTNTVIAIVDEAIWYDHPDLFENIAYNLDDPINGLDDDGDGYIDNRQGWDFGGATFPTGPADNDTRSASSLHGTWVAGHAGATHNNGRGLTGTGGTCRILPIKTTFDNQPGALYFGYEGIVYAADQGAGIINCSWGGTFRSQYLEDVVNYATFNRNALVVAAAGNTGSFALFYPASYENVLAVTSSNADDRLWSGATYSTQVDLAAPGNTWTLRGDSNYTLLGNATSFSAPVVAGMAGLLRSYRPTLTAVQARLRMRATGVNIDSLNPTAAGLIGGGRADALAALTATTPGFTLRSYDLFGPTGPAALPGDTAQLVIQVQNLLDSTAGVRAHLRVASPALTVLDSVAQLGEMPTGAIRGNLEQGGFRLVVGSPLAASTVVRAELWVVDTNGAGSRFYVDLVLNPGFRVIDTGTLQLTVTQTGLLGYTETQTGRLGSGAGLSGENSVLYEGGFVLAASPVRVADNLRVSPSGSSAAGWVTDVPFSQTASPAPTTYTHRMTASALGVAVEQHTLVPTFAPFDASVVLRYRVHNTHPTDTLRNLFGGLLADWDVGADAFNDTTEYLPAEQVALAYGFSGTDSAQVVMGLVALNHLDSARSLGQPVQAFPFSAASKHTALTAPAQTEAQGTDIIQSLSTGGLALAPGDSAQLDFAVVLGHSRLAALDAALAARRYYDCLLAVTALELPPQTRSGCIAVELDAATPGLSDFVWSNGATGSAVIVQEPGLYTAVGFDSSGCPQHRQFEVEVAPPLSPRITFEPLAGPGPFLVGEPVVFADSTPGGLAWTWVMGDGTIYNTQSGQHTYTQPGSYEVFFVVADSTCLGIFRDTIEVSLPTDLDTPALQQGDFRVYPNPAVAGESIYLARTGNTPESLTLTLQDPTGRMYYRVTVRPRSWLQPYTLPLGAHKGLYLLTLETSGARVTYKILRP